MRALAICIVLMTQCVLATASEQATDPSDQSATIICDFSDGNEITVQYNPSVTSERDQPPQRQKYGCRAGSPLTLFTQVPLVLESRRARRGRLQRIRHPE